MRRRTARLRAAGVAVALVAVAVACQAAAPAPGWNGGGRALVSVPGPTAINSIAASPDGGAWVLGSADQTYDTYGWTGPEFLLRLDSMGQPVPEFGAAGRADVGTSGEGWQQVRPGPNGSAYLLSARVLQTGLFEFTATYRAKHVLADGTVDPSYGSGGTLTRSATATFGFGVVGVAIDTDGRLLATVTNTVTRFTAAGQPDASFGSGGSLTVPGGITALASAGGSPVIATGAAPAIVSRLADSGAVAWSTSFPGVPSLTQLVVSGTSILGASSVAADATTVVRLSTAGGADASFDGDGIRPVGVPYPAGTGPTLGTPVVDGSGGIELPFATDGTVRSVRVIRLAPNGAYDGSWGESGGILLDGTTASRPSGRSFVGRPTGYDTVARLGPGLVIATAVRPADTDDVLATPSIGVTAYGPDGRPRAEVGSGGTITIPSGATRTTTAGPLVARPGGGAVLAVTSATTRTQLVGLTPTGQLDPAFGQDGFGPVVRGLPTSLDRAADGTLLLGISQGGPSAPKALAARFTAAGALDPTFGGDGVVALATPHGDYQTSATNVVVRRGAGTDIVGYVTLQVYDQSGSTRTEQSVLQRLDGSGSPIGTNVLRTTAVGLDTASIGSDLAVDASGRVLVATGRTDGPAAVLVRRWSPTLVADAGFGTAGQVVVPGSRAIRVVALASGRVLVASDDHVAALLPTGAADPAFGTAGLVDAAYTSDLAVDGSGRPLTIGDDLLTSPRAPAVRRFTTNGQPDGSFAPSGRANVAPSQLLSGWSIAATAEGPILLAGAVVIPAPPSGVSSWAAVAELQGG